MVIEVGVVTRNPYSERFVANAELVLNPEQVEAMVAVREAMFKPGQPILLFGVTGSGKTEIYLRAIREAINHGRTALVLVPEIALTPQTVERFKSRFADMQDNIAVLHSHLSEGERHDEWHKIHDGSARIVIGARSSIFAPLENLGVIIVDEEHEGSYKQDEAPATMPVIWLFFVRREKEQLSSSAARRLASKVGIMPKQANISLYASINEWTTKACRSSVWWICGVNPAQRQRAAF